jgi:TPP-dependent pyruvate/acetoin dehydrogenase alpha subunit
VPEQVTHIMTSGADVTQVYTIMQQAMQKVRTGQGPVLLEILVHPSSFQPQDPLLHLTENMRIQGIWNEEWAAQLHFRLQIEVEQAIQDALRDTQNITEKDHHSSHIF